MTARDTESYSNIKKNKISTNCRIYSYLRESAGFE